MQVFEFHFNPPLKEKHDIKQEKTKNDLVFDSFCYEPENMYEKKAGSLYMTGLLKNALPNNLNFLDNLAKIIKDRYYKSTISSSEKSLRESLRKANEYLEAIARKGDVSWLGNISFSTLSVAFLQKGYEFNFTKVGEIKIFLLRNGHLIDIDQKLKFEEIEPYPLKIFGNIVSGKLLDNDVVLVFTKDVLDLFQNQNILFDICKIQSSVQFDSKKLKEILREKREELLKIRGVFLAIIMNKETPLKEKEKFLASGAFKIFSLKKPEFIAKFHIPKLSVKNLQNFLRIRIPFIKIPKLKNNLPKSKIDLINIVFGRNLILVIIFIIFLTLGFLIFQQKEKQQIAQYQSQLNQIKEKTEKAENYLAMAQYNPRSKNQANALLKESLEKISVFAKISPSLPKNLVSEIKLLEKEISEKLYELNKLKIVTDPKIVFEFKAHEFVPQKIIYFENKIYLFNPFAENIFELNLDGSGQLLTINKKTDFAAKLNNSIIFLSKSGEFSNFENGQFAEISSLKTPYPEFYLSDIASYYSNLYILDNKNKSLIKYSYLGNIKWSDPNIWLKNESVADIKSIAVDGSVWALTTNDSIQKYYAQKLQGNLKFDIFPEPKNFSKIFTLGSLPYLYLSEPSQQRIVILNKSGQIENQIQSQSFDNLLDFAVSENGKTLYILNGLKIYQIDL